MFLICLIIFSLIALFSYFSIKRFLKNLIILPSECVFWFYWILFLIYSIKNCQNNWHDLYIQIYKCSYVFLKTSHRSYHRLGNIFNQLIISNSFFANGIFLHISFLSNLSISSTDMLIGLLNSYFIFFLILTYLFFWFSKIFDEFQKAFIYLYNTVFFVYSLGIPFHFTHLCICDAPNDPSLYVMKNLFTLLKISKKYSWKKYLKILSGGVVYLNSSDFKEFK